MIVTIVQKCSKISPNQIDEVNLETNFIGFLFTKFISKIKIKGIDRVSVEFRDDNSEVLMLPPSKFVRVCRIYWPIKINEYNLLLEKEDRYSWLLNNLISALTYFSDELGCESDVFESARLEILNSNFQYNFVFAKSEKSVDQAYKAHISIQLKEDENLMILEVFNKEARRSIKLFNVSILEWDFTSIAHKLKWNSQTELEISNKENEIVFIYDLIQDHITLKLIPRIHSLEYLKDQIKILDARTSKEEYIRILKNRLSSMKS